MRFELSVACSILILFLDDDICLGELRITIYAVVCYICACMSSKKLCIYIYIYDICFSPMILQQNVIYIYMIFVFHLRFSSKKFCIYIYIYIYMIFVFHLWFSSKKLYIYIFIFIYDICFSPMILQQKVIYIYIHLFFTYDSPAKSYIYIYIYIYDICFPPMILSLFTPQYKWNVWCDRATSTVAQEGRVSFIN